MRKTTLTLCLATLSVLAACGGGSDASLPPDPTTGGSDSPANPPASSAVTAASSCNLPNFQADVIAAVNAARAQARNCGNTAVPAAAAMRWNDKLFAASAVHSADMAARNEMTHIGSDGSEFWNRTEAQGYKSASSENVAYGYGSVQDVMQGWINSAGHCTNIMRQSANDVAVACVRASNSTPYWTMVLGKS